MPEYSNNSINYIIYFPIFKNLKFFKCYIDSVSNAFNYSKEDFIKFFKTFNVSDNVLNDFLKSLETYNVYLFDNINKKIRLLTSSVQQNRESVISIPKDFVTRESFLKKLEQQKHKKEQKKEKESLLDAKDVQIYFSMLKKSAK